MPAAKRETSRGAASRPRVLRSSGRPATAPQPANMLPRLWLGTGMIALSMSKMIPIQTGNDRPRWSEHFRERCNPTAEIQRLHLRLLTRLRAHFIARTPQVPSKHSIIGLSSSETHIKEVRAGSNLAGISAHFFVSEIIEFIRSFQKIILTRITAFDCAQKCNQFLGPA